MKAQPSLIMPNLNKRAFYQAGFVEIVPQQDGRKENTYFVVAIVSILALAALLLVLTVGERSKRVALPANIVSLSTQLQNAAEEIAILSSVGELAMRPTLDELITYQIDPFLEREFESPKSGCFIHRHDNHLVRLNFQDSGWQVMWREQIHSATAHAHHDDNALCNNNNKWQHVSSQTNQN